MIKIDSIKKSFGSEEVLSEVTMQLHEKQVYGLVGANGSGKTTLFNCIAGLYPFKGTVRYDKLSPLKNHIGFLETEPYFFPRTTGREYLYFCCHARQVDPKPFKDYNPFNLPLDKYTSSYSTGMKKKLAFQGILMQQNDFLLLDEPFNGIDLISGLAIKKIILRLRNEGKIVLMSSHVLPLLKDICDTIFYLQNGVVEKVFQSGEFELIEDILLNSMGEI
ncbi:MAG: ATP-binding cassette domain-containing protein [Ekhidna sp.]|nr:ATP-binding cassette domain-containing protein [Ekhidna sp.]MBC6411368.1 ATP-binding cassette domain-containing protein [Ekhidna sp.]